MKWEPASPAPASPDPAPASLPLPRFGTAIGRGLRNRSPVCGVGQVFNGYLTLVEACSHCHAPLGRLRADDAPPYFTILLVGHLLVPGVLWVEKTYQPPMWLHMVVWLPLFTLFCMVLLRPVKGAVVGWMTTLGFGAEEELGPARPAVPAKAAPVAAAPPSP